MYCWSGKGFKTRVAASICWAGRGEREGLGGAMTLFAENLSAKALGGYELEDPGFRLLFFINHSIGRVFSKTSTHISFVFVN